MIDSEKILLAELAAALLRDGELPVSQQQELDRLLAKYPEAKEKLLHILQRGYITSPFDIRNIDLEKEREILHANILVHQVKNQEIIKPSWWNSWKIAAVAALLLCIGYFGYIQLNSTHIEYIVEDHKYGQKNDVLPGATGAILEIEGGKTIDLGKNRKVDPITGAQILNNQLTYNHENPSLSNSLHTLKVPTRCTYQVVLSDGSKVWLNSETEIEYLANFTEKERRIKVSGEAYFDVMKDSNRPFIVESNGLSVQALGTSFNVKSYGNNALVQLVEGKLAINDNQNSAIILAGQQVYVNQNGFKQSDITDLEEVTAWKEGYFYFNEKTLSQILADVRRWYGVEVKMNIINKTNKYKGGIHRKATLAELCQVLEDLTGYKYYIEGKTLAVTPK